MVITFMPFFVSETIVNKKTKETFKSINFFESCVKSLKSLDNQRLGKQRSEAKILYNTLVKKLKKENPKGWANHPACLMWDGYMDALAMYHNLCIEEWKRRGMKNEMAPLPHADSPITPWWVGLDEVHFSHQAALLRKDRAYYAKSFPDLPEFYKEKGYVWPSKLQEQIYNLENITLTKICAPVNTATFRQNQEVKPDLKSLRAFAREMVESINELAKEMGREEENEEINFDKFKKSELLAFLGMAPVKSELDKKYKIKELKELAKQHKIVGYSKMKKAELLAKLKPHIEEVKPSVVAEVMKSIPKSTIFETKDEKKVRKTTEVKKVEKPKSEDKEFKSLQAKLVAELETNIELNEEVYEDTEKLAVETLLAKVKQAKTKATLLRLEEEVERTINEIEIRIVNDEDYEEEQVEQSE